MAREKVYPAPIRTNVSLPDEISVVGVKALGTDLSALWVAELAWREGRGPIPDLRLRAEPWNPVDPNAIRVEWDGELVGYVPAKIAANVDPDEYEIRFSRVLTNHGRQVAGTPSGVRVALVRKERP